MSIKWGVQGMKFDTREAAWSMARDEKRKYQLDGWTTEVWENLGWHYCFKRGRVCVRVCMSTTTEPSYYAIIAKDVESCGSGQSSWTARLSGSNRNPLDAVRVAYATFDRKACEVEILIEGVREEFRESSGMECLTRPKLETSI